MENTQGTADWQGTGLFHSLHLPGSSMRAECSTWSTLWSCYRHRKLSLLLMGQNPSFTKQHWVRLKGSRGTPQHIPSPQRSQEGI